LRWEREREREGGGVIGFIEVCEEMKWMMMALGWRYKDRKTSFVTLVSAERE